MRNKKRDTKETAFMVISFLVIVGFFGDSYLREEMDTKTLVISGIFLAFIFAWTMADVVVYRNKYFRPEDKDKSFFKLRRKERKKKKIYKETFVGKDMYDVCERYVRDRISTEVVLLLILILFVEGIFFILTGTAIHWGFYVGIPIGIILPLYLWKRQINKDVKHLRTFLEQSSFDEMRVNQDFMTGSKHFLGRGCICVGMQYVVVCHFEKSLVFELSDVTHAEKEVETYRSRGSQPIEIIAYNIIIHLKKGVLSFRCIDDVSADLLVEEFKHRGYFNALEEVSLHEAKEQYNTHIRG